MDKNIIIAIDGHSSCGKSTVAKRLAKELNYKYIDTGAMYRAVTLFALQANLINKTGINEDALYSSLKNGDVDIEFRLNTKTKNSDTYLNDILIEDEIRNIRVADNVSQIAVLKVVRENLVARQQKMGENGNIVMDGRDIGTAVFPKAELKIFLTANADIRAKRRFYELIDNGENVTFEEVFKNISERDHIDSTRKINPLRQAEDAYLVDNSNFSQEETFDNCYKLYENVLRKLKKYEV